MHYLIEFKLKSILTTFSTPISQPVHATMIRLCVNYCFVDFYSPSYVLYCVRYSAVAVCQLFNKPMID